MGKTSKELKLNMSLAEWLSLNHDALLPLTKIGGIISCPHPLGKDYAVYMMLDEVREYFEPHVAKYIARKKKLGFDRLEQLAMGRIYKHVKYGKANKTVQELGILLCL